MCMYTCRSFKKECPAFISLRIDESGNRLEVKSMCEDHNHAVSKVILLMFKICIDGLPF